MIAIFINLARLREKYEPTDFRLHSLEESKYVEHLKLNLNRNLGN